MSTYQLLYQSYSLIPFEPRELDDLLLKSRTYNEQHHITGLLLYTPDGRFLQLLEGPREAVRRLYHERIGRDPRHYNCHVLGEGPCEARSFGSWSMAFRPAQARDLRSLLAPVPVSGSALLVPRPHTRAELVALLVEFVHAGELAPVS